MTVVLCRVDDRLIHGQVVLGWARALGVQRIALADDDVAASPWEQELYRMAVPNEVELVFAPVLEAGRRLAGWHAEPARTLVLCGTVEAAGALYHADPVVAHRINLGGIHHRAGRSERAPYVYLSEDEYRQLQALAAEGAQISGQDVPTAPAVPLEALA